MELQVSAMEIRDLQMPQCWFSALLSGRSDGTAPVLLAVLVLSAMTVNVSCSGGDEARRPDNAVSGPAAHHDTIFTVEEVDQKPEAEGGMQEMMENVEYPDEAKRKGITGRVMVRFVVSPQGKPINPQVVDSVHPLLDEEAVRAVSQTSWSAGLKEGNPVPVQMEIPVTFKSRTMHR